MNEAKRAIKALFEAFTTSGQWSDGDGLTVSDETVSSINLSRDVRGNIHAAITRKVHISIES